jgi:hypothetical protein
MERSKGLANRGLFLWGAALVLTALVSGALGYSLEGDASLNQPAVSADQTRSESVRGVVAAVRADSLTLNTPSGTVDIEVPATTPIERFHAINREALRPGDWLNAGGVPHDQTMFALTGLVVIPRALLKTQ